MPFERKPYQYELIDSNDVRMEIRCGFCGRHSTLPPDMIRFAHVQCCSCRRPVRFDEIRKQLIPADQVQP